MTKQKQIKCPYCHAGASLRPASVVYGCNRRSQGKFLYLCDRWPACDAYVSAHDRTHQPILARIMTDTNGGRLGTMSVDKSRRRN